MNEITQSQKELMRQILRNSNTVEQFMLKMVNNETFTRERKELRKWWLNLLNFKEQARSNFVPALRDWTPKQKQSIYNDIRKHIAFIETLRVAYPVQVSTPVEAAPHSALSKEDAEYAERLATADAGE
jgi:hypothetical protein